MSGDGGPAEAGDTGAVRAWLEAEGARFGEMGAFVAALAERLDGARFPVDRLTTGVPLLHPQVDSFSSLWSRGRPLEERHYRREGSGDRLTNSPMAAVYEGRVSRHRLEGPARAGEFAVLAELRAEGFTDYLALPIPFSDGSFKALTFATRRPGGFGAAADGLAALVPTLALVLEILALRRTALTLLDTYVGPAAGRRVLDGVIKRGMFDEIRAVVWMSDLRGFTALSERLGGGALIALLDDYFGAMTEAVAAHGGEVLKFIGDALLAIFPLPPAADPAAEAAVAGRALAAAAAVEAAVAAANQGRRAAGRPEIAFGLALHAGDVLYGNIGGADRLDFTVIGRAVNLASRIESLTKEAGRPVLLSEDFARLLGRPAEAVGAFAVKGLAAPLTVYAPPSSSGQSTRYSS